jgi:hypothetical protein
MMMMTVRFSPYYVAWEYHKGIAVVDYKIIKLRQKQVIVGDRIAFSTTERRRKIL